MKKVILAAAVSYLALSTAALATGPLLISEFMVSNDGSLLDRDGEASDWIEIYNAGTDAVSLAGWHLTDDAAVLAKWTFPATSLGPGQYLIVFASGKDRAVAGAELHTSFQLNAAGDYLALVEPDGETIAHQYAPAYPPQVQGVSYGVAVTTATSSFVLSGALARWEVPSEPGDMPANWMGTNFDHSAWSLGPTGLGYSSGFTNGAAPGPATNLALGRPATQSSILGGFTPDLAVNGNLSDFTHTLAGQNLPSTWQADLGTNYALERIVLHNRADCCGSRLRDITIEVLSTSAGHLLTNYTSSLLNPQNAGSSYPGGPPTITNDLFALTGGVVSGQIVRVRRTPDPSLLGTDGRGNSDEADVLSLAEVEVFGGAGDLLSGLIETDLAGAMRGSNATVLARIVFGIPVEGMPLLDRLTLRMKYDDGFVAYLNGVEIARRNAPATLAWNSAATSQHPPIVAAQFEDIDVSPFIGSLQEGENVLAFQGLNVAAADGGFLLLPELVGHTSRIQSEGYFAQPTPGAANNASFLGLVADTKFSVDRGLFSAPFTVTITTATAGAEIRYTTNGWPPSAASGFLYTGPITISRTTVLRAIATKPGYRPSDVDTQTYVFLSNTIAQSNQGATNAGFPGSWAGLAADYAMDPRVTGPNAARMEASLRSLPSVFLTTTVSNLFDVNNGIYSHPTSGGGAWERPASIEMISTNGGTEFKVDCGLRIQGGYFRQAGVTHKHSLRVLFKSQYGAGRLHHDLFHQPDAATDFDTLVFRAGANDGYAWSDAKDTEQFIRDEFGRELQLAMGRPAPHGLFVHLYLDGLYWGLYNLTEHPNEDFSASYLGGAPEDWDSNNAGDIKNGDLQAWNAYMSLVQQRASLTNYQKLQGNYPDGTRNPAYPVYLDPFNYIDYMIVNMWGGNWDWPNKNFWFGRKRTADSTGFKFYTWDYENTMGNNLARSPTNMVAPRSDIASSWVGAPHYYLKNLPEYCLNFADRVQEFFFDGGLLTPQVLSNRYRLLADRVEAAIVSETARWGDDNLDPPQDISDWLRERDWILGTYLPVRSGIVFQQFRSGGLYPGVSAPVFSQHGGIITNGFPLAVYHSNATGTIYYTLDGTDPRLLGGAVNPAALTYSNALALDTGARLEARVLRGTNWSALNQADFVLADVPALRITELMYHPAPVSLAEAAAGFASAEGFEFVELRNVGPVSINLAGISFTDGIKFAFTNGTLAAGERVVLVKDVAAFTHRYGPSAAVAGVYSGSLDNAGERVRLVDPIGRTILDFSYADGWYPTTDGFGFSLVIRDETAPASTWQSKESWTSSSAAGGSPGQSDLAPTSFPFVVVNELLSRPAAPAKVAVELVNLGPTPADIGGWWLTDTFRQPRKFRVAAGTVIPVGGFLVLSEDDFGGPGSGADALDFSPTGGEAYLFSADVAGELTGYSQGFDFGAADVGASFGRYVTSTGSERFVAQVRNTLGAPNAGPRVGPVVVSALMYHPPDVGGGDNTRDEYIELLNIAGQPVPLFDPAAPENTWQIKGGVDFPLPPGLTLAAGERLLVVNFDPAADSAALAFFRSRYSVPDAVRILGPYAGKLNNSGDNVELKKPALFQAGTTDDVQVDKVNFHEAAPWPDAADGYGPALRRLDVLAYGDDPANWVAARPSPGQPAAVGLPPTVLAPLLPQTAVEESAATFNLEVDGAGPFAYQWLFNGQALDGATDASLVLPAIRLAQDGDYSVYVMNGGGSVGAGPAHLTVLPLPVITLQPNATNNVGLGSNFTLRVAATGTGPLSYQWQSNSTGIPGATGTNYSVTNAQMNHSGTYRVLVTDAIGTRASQSARVTVLLKPTINTQPSSQTVAVGDPITLTVQANGSTELLGYRWRKNGLTYLSTAVPQLAVARANLTNAGRYEVIVTNLATLLWGGNPLSTSALVMVVAPPTNQAVLPGNDVTLRVVVGQPSLFTNSFFWLFNGSVVAAGTNTATTSRLLFTNDLALANFSQAQEGFYTFLISNAVTVTNTVVTANPPATNYVVVTNLIGASAAFTAGVFVDSDADGIPDWWESLYGFSPLDPKDAGQDADGDGLTNLQEYLAGTDPCDSGNVLKLVVLGAAGQPAEGLGFEFEAVSNRTYQVEYEAPLGSNRWMNLMTVPARPTNRIVEVKDTTPGTTERYYRVRTP